MSEHRRTSGSSTGPGRNPPEEYRFKPGQSGNPTGRPRKAKSESVQSEASKIGETLLQVAQRLIPTSEGAEVSYQEALCTQLASGGLNDPRIGLRLVELFIRLEQQQARDAEEREESDTELDAILEREVQRRYRRHLQQRGMAADADEFMNDQFQPDPNTSQPDAATRKNSDEGLK